MSTHRRGAASVAIVAALVVAGLVVVGLVLTTANEGDMVAVRADSLRAFYAADSGINMAVREMMTGQDYDGDGGIGSISNDGNAANDPLVGGARVSAGRVGSGWTAALTSAARIGSVRRTIGASTETFGGGTRWMLYCDWPNAVPSVMQWNGRG